MVATALLPLNQAVQIQTAGMDLSGLLAEWASSPSVLGGGGRSGLNSSGTETGTMAVARVMAMDAAAARHAGARGGYARLRLGLGGSVVDVEDAPEGDVDVLAAAEAPTEAAGRRMGGGGGGLLVAANAGVERAWREVVRARDVRLLPSLAAEFALPGLFLLTPDEAARAMAPSMTLLGLASSERAKRATGVAELDTETDVSPSYLAQLRATARALTDVLTALGVDVRAGAFSGGGAARLVANTVVGAFAAMPPPSTTSKSSNDAVLLVVDRSLDWASALSQGESAPRAQTISANELRARGWGSTKESRFAHAVRTPSTTSSTAEEEEATLQWLASFSSPRNETVTVLERLHDQMLATDDGVDGVIAQISDALAARSIAQDAALALALRAVSLAGVGCADPAVEASFTSRMSRPRVALDALRDAARAEADACAANSSASSSRAATSVKLPQSHRPRNTLVGDALRAALKEGADAPWIAWSSPSTLAHVARVVAGATGLLSSLMSAAPDNAEASSFSASIRRARRVVVFFLGGVSSRDYGDILASVAATDPTVRVVVGGSRWLTPAEALHDATSVLPDVSPSSPISSEGALEGTTKDKARSVAALFA